MPWIDFTAGAGGQWSMAFLRNIFSVRNLMWVVVIVFLVWWFMPGFLPGSSLLRSRSWSNIDFSKSSVDMSEITSGGPRKDGIPSIDKPTFTAASKVDIPSTVPVLPLLFPARTAYSIKETCINDTCAGLDAGRHLKPIPNINA